MEEGTAQLKQIVDSGELQKGLTNASEELSNVLKSGAVQTGLKNTVENSQEIIDNLKNQFGSKEVQAFKDIGREVVLASGVAQMANNTKVTNNIKNTLKNALPDIKNSIPKDKFKEISSISKQLVSSTKPMIKDMVNTTFDELAPQLNGGLKNLYKKEYGKILAKTGSIALAKKAATAAQVAEIPNVLNIQDSIPCVVKNITDKLLGDVTNLLTQFVDNVDNFTDCIGDQFIGAIFNDVIKGINSELAGAIAGVANIFPNGDIEGLLRS